MPAHIPYPQSTRDARQNGARAGGLSVWLATPQARHAFDLAQLNEADLARWAVLRHPQRREELVVSRALLRFVAPPDEASRSLSHSGGHAALCVGPSGCSVGIDIEKHRSSRDVLGIARFAFHEQELAALESAASTERERLFYSLWVLKEAAAKALRIELLDALRHCVFLPRPEGYWGSIPAGVPWSAWLYEPRRDLSLAVVGIGAGSGGSVLETTEWPLSGASVWPLIARMHGADGLSDPADSSIGFFENHRLAVKCCPHHDGCVTGSPQGSGDSPGGYA